MRDVATFSKLSVYLCFNIPEPEFIIGSDFFTILFFADLLVKIIVSPFHPFHIHSVNMKQHLYFEQLNINSNKEVTNLTLFQDNAENPPPIGGFNITVFFYDQNAV